MIQLVDSCPLTVSKGEAQLLKSQNMLGALQKQPSK